MSTVSAEVANRSLGVCVLTLWVCLGCPAWGQNRIYAYTNEQGLRVITNIPPAGQVETAAIEVNAAPGTAQPVATLPKSSSSKNQIRALSTAWKAEAIADRISSRSDILTRRADLSIGNTRRPAVAAAPVSAPIAAAESESTDALIAKHAARHNLEPELVRALIKAESNFNSRAVSRKGARGLMQLMPDTAWRYGVRNIFDPEENIAGGVSYLNDLLQIFDGNIPLALSAYNAGENLVARIQRIPNYPETQTYVARIGRMFDFQRSPYITPQEPPQPRLRVFRRADGVLEITNLEPSASNVTQLN